MTKNEHTPGPWAVDPVVPALVRGPEDDPRAVANTLPTRRVTQPTLTALANAQLIAAAPELLAALEALEADVRYLVEDGTLSEGALEHPSMVAARAAIAKARGEVE